MIFYEEVFMLILLNPYIMFIFTSIVIKDKKIILSLKII